MCPAAALVQVTLTILMHWQVMPSLLGGVWAQREATTYVLLISALIWLGWAKLDSVVWWPLLCACTVVIVYLGCVALTSLLARGGLAKC